MIQVSNRQPDSPHSLLKKEYYDGDDVKKALANLSTGCKCVYCERILPKLDEDNLNNIRAIEHYYPKNPYPLRTFEWTNLFLVCKNCNSKKQNYDTQINPFVHPENDNPEEYFEYDYSHRIKVAKHTPNQTKSQNTIDKTMKMRRLEITWGSVILSEYRNLEIELEQYLQKYQRLKCQKKKTIQLNKILNGLKELKIFATDEKEYAGRRRFLIRQSSVIQVITTEINNHLSDLDLTENFEWNW